MAYNDGGIIFKGGRAYRDSTQDARYEGPVEGISSVSLRTLMRPMNRTIVATSKVTTRTIASPTPSITYASQTGTAWNSGNLRYLSGEPVAFDPAQPHLGGLSRTTGADNVTALQGGFILAGDRCSIHFYTFGATDMQVYVDGEALWSLPQTTGSGYQFVDIQFATDGAYEIIFVLGNGLIVQIVHNTYDSIVQCAKRFTLALFGDSYADAGQGTYNAGLGGELLAETGWGVVNFGQGSTGWGANLDNPNTLGKSPYESADRAAAVAAQSFDAMLCIGSINSGDVPPLSVRAALIEFWEQYRANKPGIPLFIAGVEPYNVNTSQKQTDNNTQLRVTCGELGIPFIDWYSEQWMTGVSTPGVPGGTGTQQKLIGADGVHASRMGNSYLAKRFAAALGELRVARP